MGVSYPCLACDKCLAGLFADRADYERYCVAGSSRHNSLFQLFWLSPGPGERSLIAGGRAASSLNCATTFATCTFNPSCFLALPSISQSHSLPHFATHPRFATYVKLNVDEGAKISGLRNRLFMLVLFCFNFPLTKTAPLSLMGVEYF